MSKSREEADNEEAYWFVRWCQQRQQINRLKKAIEEIGKSEIAILRQENIRLKNTLDTIRKDFVPEAPRRKRTFRGNNPNK